MVFLTCLLSHFRVRFTPIADLQLFFYKHLSIFLLRSKAKRFYLLHILFLSLSEVLQYLRKRRSLQISLSFSLFLFLSRLHSGTGQKNACHVLLSSLIYDRVWDHVGVCGRLLSMTCVGVLESGNLASVFAFTGHGFSPVSSLMYIFRGLLFLSNKNLSVLPPTFNRGGHQFDC